MPQVACFDTAFHHMLPPPARQLARPDAGRGRQPSPWSPHQHAAQQHFGLGHPHRRRAGDRQDKRTMGT
ncbi:MAG TPA: hypothetical protein VMV78_12635 [Thiobacillus sp.]|nr:hypothetical protein [Thiobacillus sp.]